MLIPTPSVAPKGRPNGEGVYFRWSTDTAGRDSPHRLTRGQTDALIATGLADHILYQRGTGDCFRESIEEEEGTTSIMLFFDEVQTGLLALAQVAAADPHHTSHHPIINQ